jgi:hypothetical protein
MARALECPACGEKHRIDNLSDSPTFRCVRCGQILKVPAPIASGASSPPPRVASPVVPPPRRQNGEPSSVSASGAVVGVSATVSAVDGNGESRSRADRRQAGASGGTDSKVRWYWRLLAWVAAIPLGFVIMAWPAYRLSLIRKSDVLNVFVGSGTGRYARLAIGTAVWALLTALLVQLFVDGGRWLAKRRKVRAALR